MRDELPRINQDKQAIVKTNKRDISKERNRAKRYYDRSARGKESTSFHTNQRVAVQDEKTGEWTRKGKIVSYVHPRSFIVRLDKTGSVLRRNQRFLRGLHAILVSSGPWGDNSVGGNDTTIETGMHDTTFESGIKSDKTIPYDSETDSDKTIPYESDSDSSATIPYEEELEKVICSKAGRVRCVKVPLDYNDL